VVSTEGALSFAATTAVVDFSALSAAAPLPSVLPQRTKEANMIFPCISVDEYVQKTSANHPFCKYSHSVNAEMHPFVKQFVCTSIIFCSIILFFSII
jgi:hypothetical protein